MKIIKQVSFFEEFFTVAIDTKNDQVVVAQTQEKADSKQIQFFIDNTTTYTNKNVELINIESFEDSAKALAYLFERMQDFTMNMFVGADLNILDI